MAQLGVSVPCWVPAPLPRVDVPKGIAPFVVVPSDSVQGAGAGLQRPRAARRRVTAAACRPSAILHRRTGDCGAGSETSTRAAGCLFVSPLEFCFFPLNFDECFEEVRYLPRHYFRGMRSVCEHFNENGKLNSPNEDESVLSNLLGSRYLPIRNFYIWYLQTNKNKLSRLNEVDSFATVTAE